MTEEEARAGWGESDSDYYDHDPYDTPTQIDTEVDDDETYASEEDDQITLPLPPQDEEEDEDLVTPVTPPATAPKRQWGSPDAPICLFIKDEEEEEEERRCRRRRVESAPGLGTADSPIHLE